MAGLLDGLTLVDTGNTFLKWLEQFILSLASENIYIVLHSCQNFELLFNCSHFGRYAVVFPCGLINMFSDD